MEAVLRRLADFTDSRVARLYYYLQFLDFLTTVIGLDYGLSEASPFVRGLMTVHPIVGLLCAKLTACLLAVYCIARSKLQFLRYVNYWFILVVAWNLALILMRVWR